MPKKILNNICLFIFHIVIIKGRKTCLTGLIKLKNSTEMESRLMTLKCTHKRDLTLWRKTGFKNISLKLMTKIWKGMKLRFKQKRDLARNSRSRDKNSSKRGKNSKNSNRFSRRKRCWKPCKRKRALSPTRNTGTSRKSLPSKKR